LTPFVKAKSADSHPEPKPSRRLNVQVGSSLYLEIRDTSKGGKPPLRMLNLLDLHEKRTIGRYSKMEGDAFLVCSGGREAMQKRRGMASVD
jgi:hypothetical protein